MPVMLALFAFANVARAFDGDGRKPLGLLAAEANYYAAKIAMIAASLCAAALGLAILWNAERVRD